MGSEESVLEEGLGAQWVGKETERKRHRDRETEGRGSSCDFREQSMNPVPTRQLPRVGGADRVKGGP